MSVDKCKWKEETLQKGYKYISMSCGRGVYAENMPEYYEYKFCPYCGQEILKD